MDVPWSSGYAHALLHVLIVWVASSTGQIRCDCNTAECRDTGRTTCMGVKSCYTELYQNRLSRGCDPTPLACENRKPAGVELEWPSVYCCNHKDLCNKHAIPTVITSDKEGETRPQQHQQPKSASSNCSNSEPQLKSQETKVINPIYIAVPVAGVCVLLALIIFAMYLLRRRTDFHHHDNFHHYHHGHTAVLSQKQAVVPHHCQCACKKQAVPPCSKGNRCTDSERSSSGSETKLFLQS
ncbi:hypothetical protein BsWGS_00514 [Bradybaena similaris]